MDEELYEDLPGGGGDDLVQEELYDCIETYQQEGRFVPPQTHSASQLPGSGPPLPARNDPPSLPARNDPPSLPPRNQQLTNSLPPPTVAAPPPPIPPAPAPLSKEALEGVKLKPAKSFKTPNRKDSPASGGGGGGIDMKSIQQLALNRGTIDLDALENKKKKEEEDTQNPPPWAAQLKKRKPADTTSLEGKEEENVAPWVKKKSGSISEDSPPPQPSWVKKRHNSTSGEGPPPVAKKPSKDKFSDSTAVNGNVDSPTVMLRKSPAPVAPKPVKPAKPRSSPTVPPRSPNLPHEGPPNLKPKPPPTSSHTLPRQSPRPPPRRDSIGSSFSSHDITAAGGNGGGQQKKLPPPKPIRRDIPDEVKDRPPVPAPSGSIIELGPPRFTPEPPTSPQSQPGEVLEAHPSPTIPQRMPPPSVPAPPPPSGSPNPHSMQRPPFSPPSIPAPPPPSGPSHTAPPPFAPAAPHAPMAKRYRRCPVPPHDAYNPPSLPHRSSKPGWAPPAPLPSRPPQLKAPIGGAVPNFIPKPPPPAPPPAQEEFECEEFYDDVDTVKRNMPSMQQQLQHSSSVALQGVTTNVDEEEGELYDDVAGATAAMSRPPFQKPLLRPPIGVPPPPPPPEEAEQDDNYDLHPEEQPTGDENYDLHPTEEPDEMYEAPPVENMNAATANSLPRGAGISNADGDVPVEESFYEMVPTETRQHVTATASSTMPNPSAGTNKKISKSELKELKKREKEAEKERIQQEKERAIKEKERKRLEEIKLKNRKKFLSSKPFKPFALNPDELPIIFATEVVKPNIKAKDHLVLQVGEQLMILLTSHDKLPDGKYLCEKSDGTIGFVDYQSLRDNVEGEFTQDDTYDDVQRAYPPPSMPAPPPPS